MSLTIGCWCLLFPGIATAQDSLIRKPSSDTVQFSGQLSGWLNYHYRDVVPLRSGARYIPVVRYERGSSRPGKFDVEVSVNLNGYVGFHPFDTAYADGRARPYRAWVRYSRDQWEVRAGLQTINFGSASILRPLMWFEVVDPRDPLRITTGVWGLLGRYYFINNVNLWLWALYGNEDARLWEVGRTRQRYPEFGGRFQTPVPAGEAGITVHHRLSDTRNVAESVSGYAAVPENRVALDAKWDAGVGLWVEGAWIAKARDIGTATNQLLLNAGADYTFGVGNGLNVILEQLLISYDRHAFSFSQPVSFSAASVNYPLGLFDTVGAMVYYDWKNHQSYHLVSWKKQLSRLQFYVLAYWNPETYGLPQQGEENLFSGRGVQLMLVFHH